MRSQARGGAPLCLLAAAAVGCGAGAETEGPPQGGPSADSDPRRGQVLSWPEFAADCASEEWYQSPRALNGSTDDDVAVSFDSYPEGAFGPNAHLRLNLDQTLIGEPVAVDRTDEEDRFALRLQVTLWTTTFSSAFSHQGQTGGEVELTLFDAEAGRAEITFRQVRLLGEDSVYAGDYRCLIDGVAELVLGRIPLGQECREDRECGGHRSGRVCSFESLACEEGCHDTSDCPIGLQCSASGTCD